MSEIATESGAPDRRSGMGQWSRSPVLVTVLISIVTGVVAFGLFLVASQRAIGGDPATFKTHVAQAFANKQLVEDPHQLGSTTIGSHQWNDCLILVMAMDERGDPARLALSPILMDLGPTPNPSVSTNPCAVLSALSKGARPNDQLYYYDRYPNGAVVLLRYLMPHWRIARIRAVYRNALCAFLVLGLALVLVGLARGRNVTAFAVIGVTTIALMRYFGLESFSQSLGHGPADAVIAAYVLALAALAFVPASLAVAVLTAAVFGVLTIIFELFTGGFPLGIAMVIGLTPFVVRPTVRPVTAAAAPVAAFVGAGAVFYAVKMAAAVSFGGAGIAGDAVSEVLRLTILFPHGVLKDGTGFAVGASNMIHSVDTLTGGMGLLSGATLVMATLAGGWGLVRIWTRDPSPMVRQRALLLAISAAIPPLYCLFFLNLMINHSWFTDRIFVWNIAAGFGLFFMALLRDGNAASSDPEIAELA
jgi:hypothetical protein